MRPGIHGKRALFIVCGSLLISDSALAGIVEVGGAAVIAEPPADISQGLWESDTEARIWAERSVLLSSPLAVNAVNTGIAFPDGVAGDIASQPVESYMLRSDPIGAHDASYDGFVVFDQPILGLIFFGGRLNNTDALLGRPGVIPYLNVARGLDDPDMFSITADRLRVDFHYLTGGYSDDVRIITAVPEPSSVALFGMASFAVMCRRWRRAVNVGASE